MRCGAATQTQRRSFTEVLKRLEKGGYITKHPGRTAEHPCLYLLTNYMFIVLYAYHRGQCICHPPML